MNGFSAVELPWTWEEFSILDTSSAQALVFPTAGFPLGHFTGKLRLLKTPQRHARLRALFRLTSGNLFSGHFGFPARIQ